MLCDLLDFTTRRWALLGTSVLSEVIDPESDEWLAEAIFVLNIFHHKVSNGVWTIDKSSVDELAALSSMISVRIL